MLVEPQLEPDQNFGLLHQFVLPPVRVGSTDLTVAQQARLRAGSLSRGAALLDLVTTLSARGRIVVGLHGLDEASVLAAALADLGTDVVNCVPYSKQQHAKAKQSHVSLYSVQVIAQGFDIRMFKTLLFPGSVRGYNTLHLIQRGHRSGLNIVQYVDSTDRCLHIADENVHIARNARMSCRRYPVREPEPHFLATYTKAYRSSDFYHAERAARVHRKS